MCWPLSKREALGRGCFINSASRILVPHREPLRIPIFISVKPGQGRAVKYHVIHAPGLQSILIRGLIQSLHGRILSPVVAGNQTWMPKGLFQGLRTMTSNIVIEMGYSTDLHREALIATGVVLFVFILLINLCFSVLKGGKDHA